VSVAVTVVGWPSSSGADQLSAYIARDRRRALRQGRELPTRVHGAALVADISGFTAVTEALADELGSQRASEILTGHLNRVFHAIIAELDRYGGDVIYFSGDAITCWLDGDDGARATASALAMQSAIARDGEIRTPAGLSFQLGLKVAVAVGPARRFVVGDPDVQLVDVLAGDLIDRLAVAERLAGTGEIVLDGSAVIALADRVELGELRSGADGANGIRVVARLIGDARQAAVALDDDEPLGVELARPWLLPAVFERLATGRGEFLAELRPAFPVFASFGGIDYDADESASEKLDAFVRAAQHVLSGYGGNVLQLTLGDKGAYLYGVFGTPLAHEDDAARACAAALELRGLTESTAARDIRVGITHGRLRSGTYGHARRRTFVCLGDPVNLAARLMSHAPAGQIYVSELVRRMAGAGFSWKRLEPLSLKGKASPVAAYALTGSSGRRSRRRVRYALPIVGRGGELATLRARHQAAVAGRGAVIGISAEAGMGKSRLIAEFVRDARRRGRVVAMGECQAFGTTTSYFVWREIWRSLLGVPEHAAPDDQVEAVDRALRAIDPALASRAPLLDAVLGLSIPDNELTDSFDAKLRKASLENLLADCLRAKARVEPLALVLEDCHWLDPLSRDLLDVVAREAVRAAVLLVLAYRPEAGLPHGLALAQVPELQELHLEALADAEMTELVQARFRSLLGDEVVAAGSVCDLVVDRAQGNPFYAEELLNYIQAQEVELSDEKAVRSIELPGSLHSLLLSRIDTLSEAPRRTLKVASVVGRVFRAPTLPGVYPDLGTVADVRAHLETLRLLDLVVPDREDDQSYLFKHAITQEVAYESLPYALRGTLHGDVGRFIERSEPGEIERNLDLLAHHFWHSDDEEKKRAYMLRAAEAARAAYANSAAIDYYERLASILPDEERVDVLLELGRVLELLGEWERAERVQLEGLELAETVGNARSRAWCITELAEVARRQGRYEEAAERLSHARDAFESVGDDAGVGQVLHFAGTLAAQRGDYAEARSSYESSLRIRERLEDVKGTASVLSNLGIVAEYSGDYGLALSLNERALALRESMADRWAIGVSLTNLGMIAVLEERFAEARERFEEAMRLNREVGDTWMIALTDNNLGNANRGLGDWAAACSHYRASLRVYRDYGDRWAMATLLEDVARLAAELDEPERALALVGAAEALRDEIGTPRSPTLQDEISAVVDPAALGLDAGVREAALVRGRALGFAGAVETALELCTGERAIPGPETPKAPLEDPAGRQ
jgi:class 3 adenylate cyclase/tetratricopeptide (TPR) repeat protein